MPLTPQLWLTVRDGEDDELERVEEEGRGDHKVVVVALREDERHGTFHDQRNRLGACA
jgi:hypothetical protein